MLELKIESSVGIILLFSTTINFLITYYDKKKCITNEAYHIANTYVTTDYRDWFKLIDMHHTIKSETLS